MNEITRIHIAKVPFDIEIAAKHEIEKYFKELENYAHDDELMQDIEIRITELLEQRGVKSNCVITSDDILAIKKQLGQPSDFMTDESIENFEKEQDAAPKKKLYRDKEGAVLAGVLSGFANYFMVDPIWIRLGFVILFFASAGSLALLYILLWLIIPPARTAIEKMQMSGKNVNLDTIREYNESEAEQELRHQRANITRRVIGVFFGCAFLAMSVSALMFDILVCVKMLFEGQYAYILNATNGWPMMVAFALFAVAGLLLSLLFAIFSYICFFRKLNRKISISVVSIIALGIITFGSAVGIVTINPVGYHTSSYNSVKMTVPENLSNIKSLELNADSISVKYIVSSDRKITFQAINKKNKPEISVVGQKIVIKSSDDSASGGWMNSQPILSIYGPKLDLLELERGTISYSANIQDLAVDISGDSTTLNLEDGTFNKLTINATGGNTVDATNVTVNDVSINQKLNSSITLGNVKSLQLTQPQTCPSYANVRTEVKNVLNGNVNYNGKIISVEGHNSACGLLLITKAEETND